ncbi:MAG TPA: FecR domain-containing protein, partial [Puia sp.]|nr:FecR domain-containing protein [Puia sp.]
SGIAAENLLSYNKIVVPVGGQYRVTLPDGTNVWLNAASSLEYPVEFSGDRRQVTLTGEAYFEVVKNAEMPFIVNVNRKMNVNVLGTNFNIMAYEDEDRISTTLLEGSVKVVDLANPANAKILRPGQQADWSDSTKIKVVAAEAEEAIAWKDGQFLFVNEDIHSIMRKLARWYDIKVEYSESMKNKSFDGSISRNRNISEVLKLMELTKSVHFTFGEREIIVMP